MQIPSYEKNLLNIHFWAFFYYPRKIAVKIPYFERLRLKVAGRCVSQYYLRPLSNPVLWLVVLDIIFSFQHGGISWNWKAWKSKIIFFGSKSNDRRNGYWYRVNQAGKINELTPTHQPTTYAECLRAVGYYQYSSNRE